MVGTGEYGFESVGEIVVNGVSTLTTTVLGVVVSTAGTSVVVVDTLPFDLAVVSETIDGGMVPEITFAAHSTPGR